MSSALAALLAAPSSREALDAFLASHAVPVVAPDGVTFLYRGEADAVFLRLFISGLPAAQPLERAENSDLWVL